jgi:hypothetical protein
MSDMVEEVPFPDEAMAPVENSNGPVLRHVVLLAWKQNTPTETIHAIENAFRALPGEIPAIQDFEWGTDVSVEDKAQGFSHCFLLSFASESDRDAYLPHPAHEAFRTFMRPHLEKALVIDYWSLR